MPGVSITVINNYRVEWAKGYGVTEFGGAEPITDETLFQVASVSKPVVAAAALRLVEQGVLTLDDDVNKWLTSWKVPESEVTRTSKVTVRNLLNHTAGFRVMAYDGTAVGDKVPSTLDLLTGANQSVDGPIRPVRRPGEAYEYSGAGFLVLSQLLQDVTGKSFPTLMDGLVLRSAGMTNSTFDQSLSGPFRGRQAKGAERGITVPGGWLIKANMASGGLWSTARDLAEFALHLQRGYAGNRGQLLSPATVQEMVNSSVKIQDGRNVRGLGLQVAEEAGLVYFGHGGDNTGYRSQLVALTDGRGVVILVNGGSQAIIREILRAIATEYKWEIPEYLPIKRTVISVPEALLSRYTGEYEWPVGRTPRRSEVVLKDGQLYFEGALLRPESNDRFFVGGGATYSFETDNGKTIGLRMEVPGLTLRASKTR